MALRPPLALAVGAASTLLVAGCGGTSQPAATVTPSQYIEEVDALLQPPAQIASSISERAEPRGGPAPSRDRLDDLVAAARTRLAAFRALPLDDPRMRSQRDRLAGAYARMLPPMERAVDALAPAGGGLAVADGLASVGARATLASSAGPFLDALRALPSAASPPSP
jgi:hypothetical protein